jgi:tetratricopeptide (TPR) repeat protein
LLRLGEIAAARGEDPAAADDPARLEEAASEFLAVTSGAEGDEGDVASTIEPPDDLDLTAREFGPEPAWEDEADETSEEPTAAAPALVDTTLDHTDPAEWTTPEPSVAEGAALEAPKPEVAEADAEPMPLALEDEPAFAPEPPLAVEEPVATPELTAPEIAAEPDEGAPAFDLAAELSEALRDEPAEGARRPATDEDGFASLFSEFKRGVSRTLGEGDVETHFDLGIAYREMGLLDDAIGEFRYALGASTRRLDALHMMGLCALDLGRAADAVGHLEQALASPDVPHERETALRFDLGRAYEAQADRGRAIDAFERVVELDAAFQDAAQRLEALRTSDDAPQPEPMAESGEAYESFDDLIAQTAEDAEPVASESYESFDEFQADDDAVSDEDPGEAVAETGAPLDAEGVDAADVEAEDTAGEAGPASEPAVAIEDAAPVVVAPALQPEAAPEAEPAAAPVAEPEPPRKRRKLSFF